ncbi:sarcosine oxidase subunit alpha family protein [Ferruginivarius sediminum]|uniref:Sarcosine oxidase subunit alpha family protein n=1 Tax=Ferruginivarius sediminum TaxID=2661937 RepID=A0A369T7A9_9PROT|nr:sarcosine oxidase subunit alpha family protein [Ferruginivarius sediminum]RDD60245.1 sarcosine oxidase subunit alpha family protein [Ferruginivarius sediminum]
MAQRYRLDKGGRIDRDRPVDFTFNGRAYQGYAGDTLGSALLANGVHLVGRSFKYHRPRGIFSAGAEEANALVQVGEGAATLADLKATQVELYEGLSARSVNCYPSLDFDIGEVNSLASKLFPAGFYYKTFMWPQAGWPMYERFIRKAAGLGEAPLEPDPDFYDKRYAHADVLVAGAGPAGLAAALAAARSGARVILADEQHELGGSLLSGRDEVDGKPGSDWAAEAERELRANENVRILPRSVVFGYYDHNWIDILENLSDHLANKPADAPRQRMWKVRANQVVLATGAIERPLVFRDNDRPGIMLASAARSYVNRWAVRPGESAVLFTNNDGAYAAALDMKAAGIKIAAAVDLRAEAEGELTQAARDAGIEVLAGHGIAATEGHKRVRRVKVAPLSADGRSLAGEARTLNCDLVAMSGGWNPTVHLHSQSRGKLRFDAELATFVPDRAVQAERSAGACNGTFGLADVLGEGFAAGEAAAEAAGFSVEKAPRPQAGNGKFLPARWLWLTPSSKPVGHGGKHFVDFQNDVTAADLQLALREGYTSVEHVKRYTTTGMGTDQGKTSNVNALGVVSEFRGVPIEELGVTTFRPPYTPVTFGAWGGRDVGDLFDPIRRTPMHSWHARAGAEFENVGMWKRPWYYPKAGEGMHEAVQRESKAARESLGILDATTLGRIDIQGPDSAEFLNRVYTNGWKTLKPGAIRYGLMLGEDGMVMDDGVTACLGENHYLMHTTSGGAAEVLAHLEEYLQTEWPELQVYLTTVTEQYATAAIAGPNARKLLAELTDDIDVDPDAFPFMSWREGTVAGVWARVMRISFSGDLSFEINVEAHNGLHLWQTLMNAGEKYNITPYGTETMHVLRAEKGFIIVGQETDGTVTPVDLGMEKLCSTKKDFIGKRSLSRPDMQDPNRKQFVGLLPDDPNEVLEEGAQLVETVKSQPPMDMVGHVTSSYMSPNLGRGFALALVKGGLHKHGQKVYAPMPGKTIACTVTSPVFFDPEGERLRA